MAENYVWLRCYTKAKQKNIRAAELFNWFNGGIDQIRELIIAYIKLMFLNLSNKSVRRYVKIFCLLFVYIAYTVNIEN